MVDALREAGLTARTLISGMYPSSLARVRAAEPSLAPWLVGPTRQARLHQPPAHRDSRPLRFSPAIGALLPRRAGEALTKRDGGRDHGSLAGRHGGARRARSSARVASFTYGRWTTLTRIAKLTALGVSGIITNDPRLFADPADVQGRCPGSLRAGDCRAEPAFGSAPSEARSMAQQAGGRMAVRQQHRVRLAPLEDDLATQGECGLGGCLRQTWKLRPPWRASCSRCRPLRSRSPLPC